MTSGDLGTSFLIRGRKDEINIRILHSSSKAHDNGNSRNHGL